MNDHHVAMSTASRRRRTYVKHEGRTTLSESTAAKAGEGMAKVLLPLHPQLIEKYIELMDDHQQSTNNSEEEDPMNKHSNKSVLDQAELKGWRLMSNGPDNTVIVKHVLSGTKLNLRRPGYHQGNTKPTLQALYDLAGGIAKFWDTDETAEQSPAPTVVPVAALATRNPTGSASKHRGAQQRVLQFFMNQGNNTLTVNEVAKALGIPAATAASACAELEKKGELERPVRGTYRLAAKYQPTVRVHHDLQQGTSLRLDNGQLTETPASVPLSAPVAVEMGTGEVTLPPAAPAPLSAPPQVVASVDEDTVYALLDLLLPNGFKAKDIPAINEWVAASNRLVAQVSS